LEVNLINQKVVFQKINKDKMDKLKHINMVFEKYQAIFDSSPIGVCITEPNGNINLNDTFCEMLGYTKQELLKSNWSNLINYNEDNNSHNIFNTDFSDINNVKKIEKRFIKRDGNILWTEITSTVKKDEIGKPAFLVSMIKDISKEKEIVQQLTEAKEKVEEVNKIKSVFFSNMSHELRTPLVGILGFAEILSNSIKNEEEKTMAASILKSGRRLLNTLSLLMNLSELQSLNGNLEVDDVELNSACKEVLQNFMAYNSNPDLQFQTQFGAESINLKINHKLITEVLNQVINNSVTYTERGSILLKTYLTHNNSGLNNVVVEIIDTGIGIPIEKQKLVFEEFRQASEGYGRVYEGIGLGLTLTKKYVELMQGTIKLESEAGKGTRVILSFPYSGSPVADADNLTEEIMVTKSRKEVITNAQKILKNKKLLIVEDDRITRSFLDTCFSKVAQYKIVQSGKEAIDSTFIDKYDLILMDITLSDDIDGITATQEIRKNPLYNKTPIVAMTAFTEPEDKSEFLAKGCTHFLAKPFLLEETICFVTNIFKELEAA
jgi:PAS domain S-box-containing protein